MKKLIFYSILIFTALPVFLTTCGHNYNDTDNPAGAIPNLTAITVYLADWDEPRQSRAMGLDLAKMGCDYFEVVFLHNNGAVARGQWKIGEKAVVNGVYKDTPTNYGNASNPPPGGQGSAILLAGKSDKTIMAIGKLPAGTMISSDTIAVTFEVAAIKAGVKFDPAAPRAAADSSFLTAAGSADPSLIGNITPANSKTQFEEISGIGFTAFKLDENKTTRATYTFGLHSGAFSSYTGGLFVMNDRTEIDGSVIIGGAAGAGTPKVLKKQPSYTTGNGGNIEVNSSVKLDEKTVVTMNNNIVNNTPFNPEVQFTFNTTGTVAGSLFAFVFEIPVYALNNESVWYIRPGYSVFNYELDNGTGEMGGAVLIKTGDLKITDGTQFKIEVKHAPDKWRYRDLPKSDEGSRPTAEYDRIFRFGGIIVELQDKNGDPFYPPGNPLNDIDQANLRYQIGGMYINEGSRLPDNFYGLIEVTVIFTHPQNGIKAEDKFFILVSSVLYSTYDYANIDNIQTINNTAYGIYPTVINNTGQIQNLMNDINSSFNRIVIVRLNGSVNLSSSYTIQCNKVLPNGPDQTRLLMFVSTAANDNVVLGRASDGSRINISGTSSGLAAFYFGKWPFAGLTDSPPLLANTRNFTVNASATNSSKMITDNNITTTIGGGIYNVKTGKGLTVIPSINLLH
jgi:hypothetical protein